MSRWAILKKAYLLLAAIIILLSAWPTSFFHSRMPPPPKINFPSPPPPEPVKPPYEESYYDIYINGVLIDQSILVLKDDQGNLWIPVNTLDTFNLKLPKVSPKEYVNEKFLSLASFPGLTYTIDTENLLLKITAPLELFKTYSVNAGASKTITPSVPPWGGLFNYQFITTNQSSTNNINGLFDLGLFGPLGVGTSSFNWKTTPAERPWVRLLTTWKTDFPDTMQTLSLGDVISQSTNWSGSVNYGGLQWGRNFGTQPAFITFPLPGYQGTAIVPSVLDLYVNNNLASQQKVQPGVFDISDIPMIDGAGNLRIVTKDILGRDQVITANYYINTVLLKKGLTSYSLDLGILRQDLGIYSNNYSQLIAAMTYYIGLTDHTTIGFHGEALTYVQAGGLTLSQIIGKLGTLTGSAASSHSEDLGTGGLLQLAFQRKTNLLSFGYSSQYTTANFTQQGLIPGVRSPKLVNQGFASIYIGKGSIAFNYTKMLNRNNIQSRSFFTLSGTTTLFNAVAVNATLQNSLSGDRNKTFLLSMSYAITDTLFTSATYNDSNGSRSKNLRLTRQLPPGPGYGFNLAASRDASDSDDATLTLQNDIGTYSLNGRRSGNEDGTNTYSYNLDVKGGAVYMDHHLELARPISNSFGFVNTSGIPNVGVFWQGQLQGKTNKQGYLMIPNILPYQYTTVSIDPNTVPLNTNIENYKKDVAPYRNSGMLINFDIHTINNAIMTLKQTTGDVVPEGAAVTLTGSEEAYVVGSSGQLFISEGKEQNSGRAEWESGACTFSYATPPSDPSNLFPNIGDVACHPENNKVQNNNAGDKPTNNPSQTIGQVIHDNAKKQ